MLIVTSIIIGLLTCARAQNGCSKDRMKECLEPSLVILQEITGNLASGEINLPFIAESCPIFWDYEACVPQACLSEYQGVNDLLVDSFSYVCGKKREEIQRSACWSTPELNEIYRNCGAEASRVTIAKKNPCLFYSELEFCIEQITDFICGKDEATLIKEYLLLANKRQKLDQGCESTQTIFPNQETLFPNQEPDRIGTAISTRPGVTSGPEVTPSQLDNKCWECNSGTASRDSHALCPIDGRLLTERLTSIWCNAPCFARIVSHNGVPVVYRGCFKGFGKPRDLDNWQFCNSDKCNTQDMTSIVNNSQ